MLGNYAITLLGLVTLCYAQGQVINPLGTLDTPHLPEFLTNNPLHNGYPWGTRTAANTNPKLDVPNTGVTRYYNFSIVRGVASPDGFQKQVLLINGQFPGPTISANWGDWIEVQVRNGITDPEEGTTLHWHGLLQRQTPWYDGVPSVSQCPIAPRTSFTYRFRANLYGTSWYHSHFSAQYTGGLLGPLIVYGPNHVPFDIDLGPLLLSDWYHKDYHTIVEDYVGTNQGLWAQSSDNTLINGRNNFNCSSVTDGTPCSNNAGLSSFRFEAGKTYKLRLINTGAEGLQKFSIDSHNLTVIANDYVPIQPYKTNTVTLGVGQRSDILVKATGQKNSSYYMRTTQVPGPCSRASQPNGAAFILYDNATPATIPISNPLPFNHTPFSDPSCGNDDLTLTTPFYPITPDPNPPLTQNIVINQTVNASGHQVYTMDGSTFHADYNHPLLLLANEKNTSYPNDPQWNVYNFGNSSSIRVNIYNANGGPHPMHIHGHDMYILSSGNGPWDGKTIVNPQNPQRRDVQNLAPYGHLVMQFDADNPGVWPFHCHIAWHLSQGLYVNFLERPADIAQLQIPGSLAKSCKAWDAYSKNNVVLEIDDGV